MAEKYYSGYSDRDALRDLKIKKIAAIGKAYYKLDPKKDKAQIERNIATVDLEYDQRIKILENEIKKRKKKKADSRVAKR